MFPFQDGSRSFVLLWKGKPHIMTDFIDLHHSGEEGKKSFSRINTVHVINSNRPIIFFSFLLLFALMI